MLLEVKYCKAYSLNLLKGPKARMLSHGGAAETSPNLKNARCEFAWISRQRVYVEIYTEALSPHAACMCKPQYRLSNTKGI
jgi:hypothetical protein